MRKEKVPFLWLTLILLISFPVAGMGTSSRRNEPLGTSEQETPREELQETNGESIRETNQILPVKDSDPSTWDQETLENALGDVFRILDDMLLSGNPASEVLAMYTLVRTAMNQQNIQVVFERDYLLQDEQVLQTVYFSADQDVSGSAPGYIVMNSYFFRLMDEAPSLGFSLLIEAMSHGYHFLTLGSDDFFLEYSLPVERFLYAMDGVYLKALFISRYLSGVFSLTPYEEYVIQSLEVDGLASISLYVRGVDQDIVFAMAEQADAVRDGYLPLDIFLEQIQDLVDLLSEQYLSIFSPDNQPGPGATSDDLHFHERAKYITTVSTGTYLKYGVWIINELLVEYQNLIQGSEELVSQVRKINGDSAELYGQFVQNAYDISLFRGAFLRDLLPFR